MAKEGINRSISIEQPSIFGRVGTGIGKGISETLPKEIEYQRKKSGLEELGNASSNLSPLQFLAKAAGTYGATPQEVQSFQQLAQQQAQAKALNMGIQAQNQSQSLIPSSKNLPQEIQGDNTSSITKTGPVKATIESYIPKSYGEILDRAGQLYQANPALYKNDPNNAISAAQQEDQQNQSINQAQQGQRKGQQDVQDRIRSDLSSLASRAGANVPETIYNDIEQDAIDAVESGKKTEFQAGQEGKKTLDSISKSIADIKSWGDATLINSNPKSLISSMENVRKKFKELGKKREYADLLIGENGLSPTFAYANADPVKEYPKLNDMIKSLPNINQELKKAAGLPGLAGVGFSRPKGKDPQQETLKIIPELAKAMGKEGSPLSVAYELQKKGYDPQLWKDYLTKNSKRLDLTTGQIDELQKTDKSFTSWLNDFWLRSFTGIE